MQAVHRFRQPRSPVPAFDIVRQMAGNASSTGTLSPRELRQIVADLIG
jgi:hypothetical protein